MPVEIKVTGFQHVAKFRENFRMLYRFQRNAIEKLPLRKYASQALNYLREITPVSPQHHNVDEFGGNLQRSWDVRVNSLSTQNLGFEIYSRLEGRESHSVSAQIARKTSEGKAFTYRKVIRKRLDSLGRIIASSIGDRRPHDALTMLNAVEFGNKAGSFIAQKTFGFLGRTGRVVIRQGTRVNRPARAGKHLVSKTVEYIEAFILPQIREDLNARVEELLARGITVKL